MCMGPSLFSRAQRKLKLLQECCNYEICNYEQTKLREELHVCLGRVGRELNAEEWSLAMDLAFHHLTHGLGQRPEDGNMRAMSVHKWDVLGQPRCVTPVSPDSPRVSSTTAAGLC